MAVSGHPYDASSLTTGLVKLARTTELRDAALDLDRFVRTYEANTTREWGPYPGCEACQAVCFYRSEVRRLYRPTTWGTLAVFWVARHFAASRNGMPNWASC